jgi:hypothetical protein
MNFARVKHRAILLNTGQVLVVGGVVGSNGLNSAELYSPATGKWTLTGSTIKLHQEVTLTLLPSGQVLLAGGSDNGVCTDSAEIYDPPSGVWATTGSMTSPRCLQSATRLSNGQVLVAGGNASDGTTLNSAELYNPATGTWSVTGTLNTPRSLAPLQLLGNGTAVIAGGQSSANGSTVQLASAEIFNPSQGHWSHTGDLPKPSVGPAALLSNGDLLVALDAFFNPTSATWTATGPLPRSGLCCPSTATLLGTGNVLLTGFKSTYNFSAENDAMLYDFSTNQYTLTGSMNATRIENTATILPNGQVLVAGGESPGSSNTFLTSAELYTP